MIGHPVVRGWYEQRGLTPRRPTPADPEVDRLLAEVAPGGGEIDLGGEDCLNLLLPGRRHVLRVHRAIDSRRRILAEHAIRRGLAGAGLAVPAPARWCGQELLRCGPGWAELDEYVQADKNRPPERWLFAAAGRLHRALAAIDSFPPAPVARAGVSPRTLRRWLRRNQAAGHPLFTDARRVARLYALLGRLQRAWVPSRALPRQLIHGDLHPGNVLAVRSGEPVYLDLGGLQVAARIVDLGYLLAHLARGAGPDPAAFGWLQVPRLLQAYDSSSATPLTGIERRALPSRIAAVALYIDICDWADRPWQPLAAWLLDHPDAFEG